jgi:Tfp pilus assembly protein PilX
MLEIIVKDNMNMRLRHRNCGSAFLLVIFIVALLAAVVMGMLQINTEEIQIMQNQIFAAEAMAIAEAGLNDAFAEIRANDEWDAGFTNKSFAGGSYTVEVGGIKPNLIITSTGTSSQGFVYLVEAEIITGMITPFTISISKFKINYSG